MNGYDPCLRINFQASEVFNSLERYIILQLFHLDVVAKSDQELADSLKKIAQYRVRLRNPIADLLAEIRIGITFRLFAVFPRILSRRMRNSSFSLLGCSDQFQ